MCVYIYIRMYNITRYKIKKYDILPYLNTCGLTRFLLTSVKIFISYRFIAWIFKHESSRVMFARASSTSFHRARVVRLFWIYNHLYNVTRLHSCFFYVHLITQQFAAEEPPLTRRFQTFLTLRCHYIIVYKTTSLIIYQFKFIISIKAQTCNFFLAMPIVSLL